MLEIFVDNENKTMTLDNVPYDIGVSLLSFLELDPAKKNNEHPYRKLFKTDKKTLAEIQARYKNMVDGCLFLKHYEKEAKQETAPIRGGFFANIERYAEPVRRLYYSELDMLPEILTIRYEATENRLLEVFRVTSTATVCHVEFMKMIQHGLNVRMCHNCNHFFLSKGGYDTKYCDRKPQDETRTCQQIGAVKSFQAKVADSPILAEYTKIYRRFHARKRNKKITPEQFTAWTKQAATIRDKAIQENLSVDKFITEIDKILI
ncbi:MAG: DUF6076 domain-containing protein [Oscillospiraceae bacterium]|jgi:hypothetical protein|nr:DUF6076 domain-containing protein [Oscillospiraceae bacterium]